jgi:GNAT superfamily N-acetyltransferase
VLSFDATWVVDQGAGVACVIPDPVREAALFSYTRYPAPPEGSPTKKICRDGWSVVVGPGPTFAFIGVEAVAADAVEEVVAEARRVLRKQGKRRGVWFVAEASRPAGLADQLRQLGFLPWEEPGAEPRAAAMVTIDPPPSGPTGVMAREALTLEEFRAGRAVAFGAFHFAEEDRRAFDAAAAAAWELRESGQSPARTFVAIVQGEVVGCATAIFGDASVHLMGGSTREDMRGKGIYRSLVRARWDAAEARGIPALTVEAVSTSRPILERLGFTTVGWLDVLLDQFE